MDKGDDSSVQQERKLILDAVIVRVMKTRKKIPHNDLITETIHQVQHFKP